MKSMTMNADPTTLAVTTANSNQKSHLPPAHPSCCRQPRGPAGLARALLTPYRGAVNLAVVHAALALPAHNAAIHRSAAIGAARRRAPRRDVRLNAVDVDEAHAARCGLLQHEVSRRGMPGVETRCCQCPGICPNARPAISKAVTDRRTT